MGGSKEDRRGVPDTYLSTFGEQSPEKGGRAGQIWGQVTAGFCDGVEEEKPVIFPASLATAGALKWGLRANGASSTRGCTGQLTCARAEGVSGS